MGNGKKIYINDGDCHHCYKCVRVCPVKAIEVKGSQSSVRESLCVNCDKCLGECPQNLIKLQGVRERVEYWMDQGSEVIVSLHWGWFRSFVGVSASTMINGLRELGLGRVSEGVWGLAMYNQELGLRLSSVKADHHMMLTSECVVVNNVIQKYYSDLLASKIDIADPMTLHGRMIREWVSKPHAQDMVSDPESNSVKILYITPCSGYSKYIENDDNLVMTFDELKTWFCDMNVDMLSGLIGSMEHTNLWFPYECSWVPPIKYNNNLMRCYSLDDSLRIIDNVSKADNIVLDMMACSGCVSNNSFEARWESVNDYVLSSNYFRNKRYVVKHAMPVVDIISNPAAQIPDNADKTNVGDREIIEALESLAKYKEYDHHNCNACGYHTCVNFAKAMARGLVTKDMCLSYSRTLMMRKYNELMERVPSGVMMVDGKSRIINANRNMATIMGSEAMVVYEATRGMKGADVTKLVNFSDLIHRVIDTGVDVIEQEIEMDDKLLRVSIFNVETGRCVCVLASNLLVGDVLDNQIIVKTQQAIDENMEAVQQIVSLLGKSAARTQKVLSMITLKHGK